ncbi:MAG: histidine phosphatase family protein [Victivallales bacterium]|nr:histidine phosphatase family protein [Victivallales bacterium]
MSASDTSSGSGPVKTVWLMRHGSLPSECDGRLIGRTDVPLAARGRTEAAAAAPFLAALPPFDLIWASPALRVRQTVAGALPPEQQSRVEYDPELRETDFGQWENLTLAEIGTCFPGAMAEWSADRPEFAFPGGERMAEFNFRVARVREKLLAAAGTRVLMFAHGGIILGLICALLGLPRGKMVAFKLERGALCRIDVYPGGLGALAKFNFKPGEF